jgi:uncharacterized protein DUF2829
MKFMDAVSNMLSGERLLRTRWQGYTINIIPGQSYMRSIPLTTTSARIDDSIYTPSIEDIMADDWIVKS